jgi:hypothetical protein
MDTKILLGVKSIKNIFFITNWKYLLIFYITEIRKFVYGMKLDGNFPKFIPQF